MNTYLYIEEFITDYPKVWFYTIRKEEEGLTETRKFFARFGSEPAFQNDVALIAKAIEQMGKIRGAKARYFRREDGAEALPPHRVHLAELGILELDEHDSPVHVSLRLYCLRISEEIVILLGGCQKRSQKVQDSPDCLDKFRLANRVNRAFNTLLQEKSIRIKGKSLEMDEPGFFI